MQARVNAMNSVGQGCPRLGDFFGSHSARQTVYIGTCINI